MNESYSVNSKTVAETEKIGADAAVYAKDIGFVALYGDLGVGKTAFVRGLASVLAPGAFVTSPTYAIVNEYAPHGQSRPTLFHFDMYRINDEDALDSIDFDMYSKRRAVIVTEWSENIPFALPQRYLKVEILKNADNERIINISKIYK